MVAFDDTDLRKGKLEQMITNVDRDGRSCGCIGGGCIVFKNQHDFAACGVDDGHDPRVLERLATQLRMPFINALGGSSSIIDHSTLEGIRSLLVEELLPLLESRLPQLEKSHEDAIKRFKSGKSVEGLLGDDETLNPLRPTTLSDPLRPALHPRPEDRAQTPALVARLLSCPLRRVERQAWGGTRGSGMRARSRGG